MSWCLTPKDSQFAGPTEKGDCWGGAAAFKEGLFDVHDVRFGIRDWVAEHHVGTRRHSCLDSAAREDDCFDPCAQLGQVRAVCVDAARDFGAVARATPMTGNQEVDLHRGEHAERPLERIEPVTHEWDLEVAQEVPSPQARGVGVVHREVIARMSGRMKQLDTDAPDHEPDDVVNGLVGHGRVERDISHNTFRLLVASYRAPRPLEVEGGLGDVRLVSHDMRPREPRCSQEVVPMVMGEYDRFDLQLLSLAESDDVLHLVGKECRVNKSSMTRVVQDARVHGISAALRRPEAVSYTHLRAHETRH